MSKIVLANRIEEALEAAPDASFRARCISEYKRMRGWIKDSIDWETCRILDFGCGEGVAATSIALRHPGAEIVGADIVPVSRDALSRKFEAQVKLAVSENVRFIDIADGVFPPLGDFDVVLAWSVLEHIRHDWMVETLKTIAGRLRKGGFFFVYCDPLYHSPRGSLLNKYHKEPWHHLLLSLEVLRDGVLSHRSPTAIREWQQFMELNRTTAEDILAAGEEAGLNIVRAQRFTTDLAPPARLLRIYNADVLSTVGLQILFSKP